MNALVTLLQHFAGAEHRAIFLHHLLHIEAQLRGRVPPAALRNLSSRDNDSSAESFGNAGCLSPGVSNSAQR